MERQVVVSGRAYRTKTVGEEERQGLEAGEG